MPSDIDDLLEDLRGHEAAHREVAAEQLGGESRLAAIAADILARQIAAVEALVKNQAQPDTIYGNPATAENSITLSSELQSKVQEVVDRACADGERHGDPSDN